MRMGALLSADRLAEEVGTRGCAWYYESGGQAELGRSFARDLNTDKLGQDLESVLAGGRRPARVESCWRPSMGGRRVIA